MKCLFVGYILSPSVTNTCTSCSSSVTCSEERVITPGVVVEGVI